jgi:hypothetical protein
MASTSSSRFLLAVTVIASAALGILGVLFLLASTAEPINPMRLWVGVILIGIALVLVAFASKSLVKPPPITVQWSPSGEVKLEELKCPNCNAPLKVENPSVTRVVCQYCGRVVEIVEEPKW